MRYAQVKSGQKPPAIQQTIARLQQTGALTEGQRAQVRAIGEAGDE